MIRKTAIARAAALALGLAASGIWMAPAAFAQSNTTGTIYGTVDSAAGSEVLVESALTGFRRLVKPDAGGRFNLASVPTGTYTVSLVRGGAVVSKQEGIEVRVSQGSEVSLSATQTVQIRGTRIAKIDTSSATSSAVFSARDLERLPVASNMGAVIQLAPNTTKGDSRYGGAGAPSFGGSSASENAYYINGFPVTTLLTQVGFSQLPFNAIGQFEVKTGGYGAEFGRSTGGVVNIITKRGTNEWEVGGSVEYSPNSLRARERDIFYGPTGVKDGAGVVLDGALRFYNGLNTRTETKTSAYVGGPLIRDTLFFFGAFERLDRNRDNIRTANSSASGAASAGVRSNSFQEIETNIPRYLVKLDWAVTDNHSLEYTRISDKVKERRDFFGFDYSTLKRTDVQNGGISYRNWGPTPVASQQGATVNILKYTGYLTDDLTVTALVGRTKTPHSALPAGFDPSLPQVTFTGGQAPGLNYVAPQTATGNLLTPGAFDRNTGARFDVEYKLTSSHKLRAGIDYNTITSKAGQATAGGVLWQYQKATDPLAAINRVTVGPGTVLTNPIAVQGFYVERNQFATVSSPQVKQQAQYIEDQWQATKDLLLIIGLRNEGFNNLNGGDADAKNRESYIKLNKQLAPRLAAVWDLKGDASSVVKGSAGRYHVPLPTNVAVRGAGASLNTSTSFVYTGVDQTTGAPTGTTPLGEPFSANNEFGNSKDPRQVAAQNMKGNYQDELTLAFEQAVAKGWNASAKVTYRTLRTAIDDHCDDRPFIAWAGRNGIALPLEDDGSVTPFYNCALFNPGRANTFTIDVNGDGQLETINLSKADLGIPKVKRTYFALDTALEHAYDGKWWGKFTYTWSRNKGNAEGQLLSDIGQGDVATTQAYDFPEFSIGANGKLPNNRTHQFKAFGYYQALSEFGVGGNIVFASGRPRNCIGSAPDPIQTVPGVGGVPIADTTPFTPGRPITNYSGYGSAFFFCGGVATPRGSQGTLPAEFTTDLNFKYTPSFLPGLVLKADVFNVFDRQSAEAIEERKNLTGGGLRNTFGVVQTYSAPRSVKLTVAYDKKF